MRSIKYTLLWLMLTALLLTGGWGIHGRLSAAPSPPATTLVLYDAAAGTTPDQQGFLYQSLTAAATQSFVNGRTVLDTTSLQDEMAGYVGLNMPELDRQAGFTLRLTMQVEREEHASFDRAGVSLILLGSDARGIELGFWNNQIWTQEDDGDLLFTHGEGTVFDTTADLITYDIAIEADTYKIWADGVPTLSGSVRDYSAFDGPIDPYETPNFLFIGDNTRSAMARFGLTYVALDINTPPPTATPTATPTTMPTATAVPTATPTAMPAATPTATPTAGAPTPTAEILWYLPFVNRP